MVVRKTQGEVYRNTGRGEKKHRRDIENERNHIKCTSTRSSIDSRSSGSRENEKSREKKRDQKHETREVGKWMQRNTSDDKVA